MNAVPIVGRAGIVALARVDAEEYAELRRYRWNRNRKGYAVRYEYGDGRTIAVFMHRQVMGLAKGDSRQVDHRNHDPLDNRHRNLRVVAPGQNQQNRRRGYGCSRFRGVTWNKDAQRWQAQAQVDGRNHHLGLYDDEREAASAAAEFRAEHMPFAQEAA